MLPFLELKPMVPGSVQIPKDSALGNQRRKKQVWEKLHNEAVTELQEQFKSPVPMVKWLENSNTMFSLPIILLLHPVSLTVWYCWHIWTDSGWWELFLYDVEILWSNSSLLCDLTHHSQSTNTHTHYVSMDWVDIVKPLFQPGKLRAGRAEFNNQRHRESQCQKWKYYRNSWLSVTILTPEPHYFQQFAFCTYKKPFMLSLLPLNSLLWNSKIL